MSRPTSLRKRGRSLSLEREEAIIAREDSKNHNSIHPSDQAPGEPEKWVSRKHRRLDEPRLGSEERASFDISAGTGSRQELRPPTVSLLDQMLADAADGKEVPTGVEKQLREEERILEEYKESVPLLSAAERSLGITFTSRIKTTWIPPQKIRDRPAERSEQLRKKFGIQVKGYEVPPPISSFLDMKLPRSILKAMYKMGIRRPSPVQMQALPAILSGRDTIAISYTGSGKTLGFIIPMIMFSLEEEVKLHITNGEGPFGLVLCPSRELAHQTFKQIEYYTDALARGGFPDLNTVLLTGGVRLTDDQFGLEKLRRPHMIVATPGRLIDVLNKEKLTLQFCKYFCLDEADRMLDEGFEEDVRKVMDFMRGPKQTVLFSATMPASIHLFGMASLVDPIEINVGRAGAASMDVLQEIEFVPNDIKLAHLLETLQKTPPPVLIFCENKNDVDDIHEFLLTKGVRAVSTHGSKDQEERRMAVELFAAGQEDVLIGTDVASKGLDFKKIQHVINYDMPKEIENYIHRIGRTGRSGKTGIATTYVNKQCSAATLLDLKALLLEAKQRVPDFLARLEGDAEGMRQLEKQTGVKGCALCGGFGHRITNCPKAEERKLKMLRQQNPGDTGGGGTSGGGGE